MSEYAPLTPRQHQILQCMSEGKTNAEIAHQLGIAHDMVKNHAHAIFRCLGASSRTQAVVIGLHRGLVSIDRQRGGDRP